MFYQFPENFWWGSSTSGPQTEGRLEGDGKGDSNWDYWYKQAPEKFFDQVGPGQASTFYEHYQTDIDYLVKTGHNSFRTSIQWSRLIPDGDGEVNPKAVAFYKEVFQRIKDKGIRLIINLYHFDLPYALEEKGGWLNKSTVIAYERYARICFELFNPWVDAWVTFNEPIVPVEAGYLGQYHYPAIVDAKKAVQVAYYTQLASSLAVRACHQVDADKKIAIILNLTPAYARSTDKEDQEAAEIAALFQAKSFLDPSVKGEYPKKLVAILKENQLLPDYTDEELKIIKENTVDFLGVNYYQPLRVQAPDKRKETHPLNVDHFYQTYDMPGKKMNPYRGWEIYEQGIYDLAMMIKKEYGNIDWVLTENGMGVENEGRFRDETGQIQDDYRIDFIKGHLIKLYEAIRDGANCHGYLLWTFIDCWSWLNAYKNRYGLVELDLVTQERRLKKSGEWYFELAKNNGFEAQE